MKWYEIVGLVTIIGILGLAVILQINPDKDEILVESPQPQNSNKITGKYAEAICQIVEIPCPENVEFDGFNSIYSDFVGYTFISKKEIYHFKIVNQELLFREQILVNGKWPVGDWMIWSFDGGEPLPVQEKVQYVAGTFYFESDEDGKYEQWCLIHNGDWLENNSCGFITSKDYELAKEGLKVL